MRSIALSHEGDNRIMSASSFFACLRVRKSTTTLAALWLMCLSASDTACAHGFAGKRFFPTTFGVEDPFVSSFQFSDLISASPEMMKSRRCTPPSSRPNTPSGSRQGVSLEGEYRSLHPRGESTQNGFGNLEVAARYSSSRAQRMRPFCR